MNDFSPGGCATVAWLSKSASLKFRANCLFHMRRLVPVPPPSKVPDSWEDSDEEQQPQEQPPPESVVQLDPPKSKPTVQLLKRADIGLEHTESSSRPTLALMDNTQRQDHYARTRRKIFGTQVNKPAAASKPQRPPPALRARDLACHQDPDFIRDPSLYQRRFDPGFGLNDDGRGDTRPERTYESEFPDALPRR